MRPGEFYWTLKQFDSSLWQAFMIYCFWHGHIATGIALVALIVLDSVGAHKRLEEFQAKKASAAL